MHIFTHTCFRVKKMRAQTATTNTKTFTHNLRGKRVSSKGICAIPCSVTLAVQYKQAHIRTHKRTKKQPNKKSNTH